jgi:hypothetical protein
VVKNAAAHHAISAKFPKKIDNKGKTLVVQYEVKLQSESTSILPEFPVADAFQMAWNAVVHILSFSKIAKPFMPTNSQTLLHT